MLQKIRALALISLIYLAGCATRVPTVEFDGGGIRAESRHDGSIIITVEYPECIVPGTKTKKATAVVNKPEPLKNKLIQLLGIIGIITGG